MTVKPECYKNINKLSNFPNPRRKTEADEEGEEEFFIRIIYIWDRKTIAIV
jgi:hypothetical protein